MTRWITPGMDSRLNPIICLVLCAMLWGGGARAQSAGGLPSLPAVQDETGGGGAAAPAPPAPSSAAGMGRFASMTEAQDALRGAFSQGDYSAVLGLIAEIRRQYPDETFTGYYESAAKLQIQESKIDPAKQLFPRFDTRAIKTPAPRVTPLASPRATAASASPSPKPTTAAPSPSPRAPVNTPAAPVNTPAASATTPVASATTPVASATTPAASTSKPVAPASIPAPATAKMLDRLVLAYRANPSPYLIGGCGSLGVIAVLALVLRRRRRGTPEMDEEEFAPLVGDPLAAAVGTPREVNIPRYEPPEPAPARGSGTTGVFREDLRTGPTAAPGGLMRNIELEPEVIAPGRTAGTPDFEPIFTLAAEDEPTVAATPEAGAAPPPPPAWARPAAEDEDLLTAGPISFDDDYLAEESEALPVFDPQMIAESLALEEPPARTAAPRIEEALPAEAEFTFLDEATLTGIPFANSDEMTQAGATLNAETHASAPDEAEVEEFQAFRQGETVTINLQTEPEALPEDSERTRISMEPTVEKETPQVNVSDGSDDVFEREYKQGQKDMTERNWVGAIHHLSIAAALRPGAPEVKDRLREARRMRAKELEGRG